MSKAPSLYTKHLSIALGIAKEVRFPGAGREEVRQEARIALWEACRTHDPAKSNFPTWARLVIRRHLTDCLRTATREKQAVLSNADRDEQLELVASPTERIVESRDLMNAVNALPPNQRRAVVGVACGLSYREIGHPKSVDNALVAARQALRNAAA